MDNFIYLIFKFSLSSLSSNSIHSPSCFIINLKFCHYINLTRLKYVYLVITRE
jgi:hypothetical protein